MKKLTIILCAFAFFAIILPACNGTDDSPAANYSQAAETHADVQPTDESATTNQQHALFRS